jgi:oligopeptide/dipeptide ABC transporter ATP-binding protein
MIAMALVCRPKLLIADEPTTALDVTTQANILDLMRELQRDLGMSVIFITHDLGVVAEIADEVAVMYLGSIVERGTVEQVFTAPKHPYTRALLRSLPHGATRRKARLNAIRGMVPHASRRPLGCSFHDRCDHARTGLCDRLEPPPTTLPGGHEVRCFAYGDEHDLSLDRRVTTSTIAPPRPRGRRRASLCSRSTTSRCTSRSRRGSSTAPWGTSAPSTASRSRSTAARRWRSSASRDAARRRWRSCIMRLTTRPPAASPSKARPSTSCGRGRRS